MWGTNFFRFPAFIIPVAVWSLIWTGLSLWHAAKRGDRPWFIFFLLVHTAGIIEIIYLLFVAKVFSTKKNSSGKRKKS
jgi:methionyl-tRNA synthetase